MFSQNFVWDIVGGNRTTKYAFLSWVQKVNKKQPRSLAFFPPPKKTNKQETPPLKKIPQIFSLAYNPVHSELKSISIFGAKWSWFPVFWTDNCKKLHMGKYSAFRPSNTSANFGLTHAFSYQCTLVLLYSLSAVRWILHCLPFWICPMWIQCQDKLLDSCRPFPYARKIGF